MAIVWTSGSPLPSGTYRSVAFGAGVYVVIEDSNFYVSSNLTSWSTVTAPHSGYKRVIYALGKFIAVANDYVATSTNGTSWTETAGQVGPGSNVAATLSVDSTHIVLWSSGDGKPYRSTDATSWTAGSSAGLAAVCCGRPSGVFVGIRSGGTTAISSDGLTFTAGTDAPSGGSSPTGDFVDNKFVFVANSGLHFADTTPDGVTWTTVTRPSVSGNNLQSQPVGYLNNGEVTFTLGWHTAGGFHMYCAETTDYSTWVTTEITSDNHVAMAFGAAGAIILASNGNFLKSGVPSHPIFWERFKTAYELP